MTNTIKIHILDKEKVKDSIERACVKLNENREANDRWSRDYCLKELKENQRRNPEKNQKEAQEKAQKKLESQLTDNYNSCKRMSEDERNYFSNVCIVEDVANQLFYLNYKGGEKAEGTGPFDTLEKAEEWFFKQGR